jgi:hypothetical protein
MTSDTPSAANPLTRRLLCTECGRERQYTNHKHESVESYQRRRPRCRDCAFRGIKNAGQFNKGDKPWNKGIRYEQIEWSKHPLFKDGSKRYRQFYIRSGGSPECFRCGFSDNFGRKTHIHHLNKDRSNNVMSNLRAICTLCHAQEHENWRKRLWRPVVA